MMGAQAIIAVNAFIDGTFSEPRWFYSGKASPELTVPQLADFYTWTIEHHLPLTPASYLQYAAAAPGQLPDRQIEVSDQLPNGIAFFYQLTLAEAQHGLQLNLFTPSAPQVHGRAVPLETLTQATLYDAAARWCKTIADRCAHYAATHRDNMLPGDDPQPWISRAAAYRMRQQSLPVAAASANLAATWTEPAFHTARPAITVAGTRVSASIDPDGVVHVDIDLAHADAWLRRADGTVATRITAQGHDIFDT